MRRVRESGAPSSRVQRCQPALRDTIPRFAGCGDRRVAARREQAARLDERDDVGQALPGLQVGEHERPLAAHPARVAVHHLERRADHRREVDLVDDQQVRARDARPALARDLVARRDVDHVEREVGQLGAERRGEVVAAALDEHDVEVAEALREPLDRLEVDRRVLADRGVRAAAGLDADDAIGRRAPRCAPGTARPLRCRCRW